RQERLPAVVQLAATDEHGADLGEFARVAREAVGLGVDDEELRARKRAIQVHANICTRPPGRHAVRMQTLPRFKPTARRSTVADTPGLRGGSEWPRPPPDRTARVLAPSRRRGTSTATICASSRVASTRT